jgi:hypothetical protein
LCYASCVHRLLLLLALAFAATLAACEHPTAEQCQRMCWRFNELGFWERFEAEARDLSPEKREALRAERKKTWAEMSSRKFDPRLENCIRDCRRGASPDDAACVEKARTTAEARECPGLE